MIARARWTWCVHQLSEEEFHEDFPFQGNERPFVCRRDLPDRSILDLLNQRPADDGPIGNFSFCICRSLAMNGFPTCLRRYDLENFPVFIFGHKSPPDIEPRRFCIVYSILMSPNVLRAYSRTSRLTLSSETKPNPAQPIAVFNDDASDREPCLLIDPVPA